MSKKETRPMSPINRNETPFERILANFMNPKAFPLSKQDEEMLNRWEEAWTLMRNLWPRHKIVERWKKQRGLGSTQAYMDIRNAESFFGNTEKTNKDAERALWMFSAKDLLLRCKQKGDRNNEAKALLLWGKYAELDKEDRETDTSAATEKTAFTVSEKKLRKALEAFTKGGVQNFNNLNVIDIEAEEIDGQGSEDN